MARVVIDDKILLAVANKAGTTVIAKRLRPLYNRAAEAGKPWHFKIMFVRDPFDRLISGYEYFKSRGIHGFNWQREGKDFDGYLEEVFHDFCEDNPHFSLQYYDFLRNAPFNAVVKSEHIDEVLKAIEGLIDCKMDFNEERPNSSERMQDVYFTPETEAKVRHIFRQDFLLWERAERETPTAISKLQKWFKNLPDDLEGIW